MIYFLDTDTCVFILRGMHRSVVTRMESIDPNRIQIPAVVKAELMFGARCSAHPDEQIGNVERFLQPYTITSFDTDAALTYAVIRRDLESKGNSIGPNDLLIAATVMTHSGTLVTHNIGEFGRIHGLRLEDWVTRP